MSNGNIVEEVNEFKYPNSGLYKHEDMDARESLTKDKSSGICGINDERSACLKLKKAL